MSRVRRWAGSGWRRWCTRRRWPPTDGWVSVEFLVCLLVSAALIYAFVRVERRTAQPLVPLSIFRHRSLVVGDVLIGLVGAWVASEVLVLSLYGQQVLGYSPLIIGLIAVPQGIGGLLRGIAGPRLLDRVGLKAFLVGNCLLAAVSLALVLRTPATAHYPLLGVALLGVGFGSTNIIFGSSVAGSAGVANDEQGLASALLNATRQVGAAVGVAAMLSIVATDVIGQTGDAGLAGGYRLALLVSAGLAVIGALVSLGASGPGPCRDRPHPHERWSSSDRHCGPDEVTEQVMANTLAWLAPSPTAARTVQLVTAVRSECWIAPSSAPRDGGPAREP